MNEKAKDYLDSLIYFWEYKGDFKRYCDYKEAIEYLKETKYRYFVDAIERFYSAEQTVNLLCKQIEGDL